jgi:hypothetical protein
MQLGAKHVESPFIELGQISTVLYFAHFVVIVPFITLLENSLIDLAVSGPVYSSNIELNASKHKISNLKKVTTLRGVQNITIYPAGLATAFTFVIGLSSVIFGL